MCVAGGWSVTRSEQSAFFACFRRFRYKQFAGCPRVETPGKARCDTRAGTIAVRPCARTSGPQHLTIAPGCATLPHTWEWERHAARTDGPDAGHAGRTDSPRVGVGHHARLCRFALDSRTHRRHASPSRTRRCTRRCTAWKRRSVWWPSGGCPRTIAARGIYRLTPLGRRQLKSEEANWRRYAAAVFRVLEPA